MLKDQGIVRKAADKKRDKFIAKAVENDDVERERKRDYGPNDGELKMPMTTLLLLRWSIRAGQG